MCLNANKLAFIKNIFNERPDWVSVQILHIYLIIIKVKATWNTIEEKGILRLSWKVLASGLVPLGFLFMVPSISSKKELSSSCSILLFFEWKVRLAISRLKEGEQRFDTPFSSRKSLQTKKEERRRVVLNFVPYIKYCHCLTVILNRVQYILHWKQTSFLHCRITIRLPCLLVSLLILPSLSCIVLCRTSISWGEVYPLCRTQWWCCHHRWYCSQGVRVPIETSRGNEKLSEILDFL